MNHNVKFYSLTNSFRRRIYNVNEIYNSKILHVYYTNTFRYYKLEWIENILRNILGVRKLFSLQKFDYINIFLFNRSLNNLQTFIDFAFKVLIFKIQIIIIITHLKSKCLYYKKSLHISSDISSITQNLK